MLLVVRLKITTGGLEGIGRALGSPLFTDLRIAAGGADALLDDPPAV